MMENNDQLFDDYLRDRLDAGRQKEFEERLGSDQDFREEFEAHKLVLGALYAQRDRQLLSEVAGRPRLRALRRMKHRTRKGAKSPKFAAIRSEEEMKISLIISGKIENPSPPEETGKKRKRLKPVHYWGMAAGVLLIAAVIWLIPFGDGEVLVTKGEIRKMPVLVTTEALGFSSTVDSLSVQVNEIRGVPRYEFFDVLKLYLPEDLSGSEFTITYFEDTHKYVLTLGGKKYRVKKSGSGKLK